MIIYFMTVGHRLFYIMGGLILLSEWCRCKKHNTIVFTVNNGYLRYYLYLTVSDGARCTPTRKNAIGFFLMQKVGYRSGWEQYGNSLVVLYFPA